MSIRDGLISMRDEARRTGLVRRLLELARDEDLGTHGDLTSLAMIPEDARGSFKLVPRQPAVLAGIAFLPDLMEAFAVQASVVLNAQDGDPVTGGQTVATLTGKVREVLTLERTLLNLVCRLSGIATRTRSFLDAMGVRPTGRPELCDTRKTTPGLRVFEKYAVRCGGGHTHRLGLHDAVLIKDNHLAGVAPGDLPGVVRRAVAGARELRPTGIKFFEVEVDTLVQFESLLRDPVEGLGIVLLDNMNLADMREAVRLRNNAELPLLLEASGGVRLDTLRAIADTGVDRVSVGSLTHGAISVDFGLDACDP